MLLSRRGHASYSWWVGGRERWGVGYVQSFEVVLLCGVFFFSVKLWRNLF